MSAPPRRHNFSAEARSFLERACKELEEIEAADLLAFKQEEGTRRQKAFAASYALYFRTTIGEQALKFLGANHPDRALHLLAKSFALNLPEIICRAAEFHVLLGHRQRGPSEQFRERIFRLHVVWDRIAELRKRNQRVYKSEARCLQKILEEASKAPEDSDFRRILFPKKLPDPASFERWYRRAKEDYREFVTLGDR